MNSSIEMLECRRMLSVHWFAKNRQVRVRGTDADDVIRVTRSKDAPHLFVISINGQKEQFVRKVIYGFFVQGLGGNDRIDFSQMIGDLSFRLDASGGPGNDSLIGGSHHEYLLGGRGDDTLIGNGDYDELFGGLGSDWIRGGRSQDFLFGGGGPDTLLGDAGFDEIDGGIGDDSLAGGNGADDLWGEAGNDTILGGDGRDTLGGGDGNDRLYGQAGNDELDGDDDQFDPEAPFASRVGKHGNDLLDGGAGNDTLQGSHESDTYRYNNGRDTMIGGRGNDLVDARGDDIFNDPSPADHVLVKEHQAASDHYVVQQTSHLEIIHKINDGWPLGSMSIPKGIGQFGPHPTFFTTDDSGTLHMQDAVQRPFRLKEFFENWGFRHLELDWFRMNVNGAAASGGLNREIHDGDDIQIIYGHR